jgi:AraC-like DNA-binding protein
MSSANTATAGLSPRHLKEFEYKKIGHFEFDPTNAAQLTQPFFTDFIKILFLKKAGSILVDFQNHKKLAHDTLFFINPGQLFKIDPETSSGTMIFYNRDFYCIEIHDKEVACDGILFNNVYEMPAVPLSAEQSVLFSNILSEIQLELTNNNYVMEEMLRILLKQLIIRSCRIWKSAHETDTNNIHIEWELIRKFSQLVEQHYKTKHAVSEYAQLMNITPKALNKRVTTLTESTPNDIIKQRIMLEAKRLLAHTDLTVKEVGYTLGYHDPAYFVRFFTNIAQISPLDFRTTYR